MSEVYYGGTVTVKGRDLLTKIIASGEKLQFTKVVVGSGLIDEGVEPKDVEALVHPVANATSTNPVYNDGVINMIIEYRSDMNGGLKEDFWLWEFGLFAKSETEEEILFYYATLGDSPQPVKAYVDNRIDVRRYPIAIAIALDPEQIEIKYKAGAFVTAEEAQSLIERNTSEAISSLAYTIVDIVDNVRIPTTGWVLESNPSSEEYPYYVDVVVDDSLAAHYPNYSIYPSSLAVAKAAQICPTIEAFDEYVRFRATNIPTAEINGTLALLGAAGIADGGRIKVNKYGILTGGGFMIDDDGNLVLDPAAVINVVSGQGGLVVTDEGVLEVDKETVVVSDDIATPDEADDTYNEN